MSLSIEILFVSCFCWETDNFIAHLSNLSNGTNLYMYINILWFLLNLYYFFFQNWALNLCIEQIKIHSDSNIIFFSHENHMSITMMIMWRTQNPRSCNSLEIHEFIRKKNKGTTHLPNTHAIEHKTEVTWRIFIFKLLMGCH